MKREHPTVRASIPGPTVLDIAAPGLLGSKMVSAATRITRDIGTKEDGDAVKSLDSGPKVDIIMMGEGMSMKADSYKINGTATDGRMVTR
jgi:hypothetical protein